MEYGEETKKRLREITVEWAEKFITQRYEQLKKKVATGELANSLKYQLISYAANDVKELLLEFKDHGRWLDMKTKPAKGGKEYVEEIEKWIKQRGLENDFIATWWSRHGLVKKIPRNILTMIAWGIVIKRTERHRRFRWYNKQRSAAVNDLFNQIAVALSEAAQTDIKAAVKQNK